MFYIQLVQNNLIERFHFFNSSPIPEMCIKKVKDLGYCCDAIKLDDGSVWSLKNKASEELKNWEEVILVLGNNSEHKLINAKSKALEGVDVSILKGPILNDSQAPYVVNIDCLSNKVFMDPVVFHNNEKTCVFKIISGDINKWQLNDCIIIGMKNASSQFNAKEVLLFNVSLNENFVAEFIS